MQKHVAIVELDAEAMKNVVGGLNSMQAAIPAQGRTLQTAATMQCGGGLIGIVEDVLSLLGGNGAPKTRNLTTF